MSAGCARDDPGGLSEIITVHILPDTPTGYILHFLIGLVNSGLGEPSTFCWVRIGRSTPTQDCMLRNFYEKVRHTGSVLNLNAHSQKGCARLRVRVLEWDRNASPWKWNDQIGQRGRRGDKCVIVSTYLSSMVSSVMITLMGGLLSINCYGAVSEGS